MSNGDLPEVILFDLDDTIVSHTEGIDELWRDLCHQHAAMVEGLDPEKLYEAQKKKSGWYWSDQERHRMGRTNLRETRRALLAEVFEELGFNNPEVSNSIADSFTIQREELVYLYPWSINTLKGLKDQNIKLGMITNGTFENQRRKIDKFKLDPYFDCIVIEGGFGIGKPGTEIFYHALEKLGASNGNAWMVGDDLKRDILGANNAGIYSVWVDWKHEGLTEKETIIPDKIIHSIEELLLT